MKGVGFERAFPFVGRRLKIDRVRRFKRADLMGKALRGKVPTRALRGKGPVNARAMRKLKRARPRIRRPRIGGFGR